MHEDVKCKPRAKRAEYVDEPGLVSRVYESEYLDKDPLGWLNAQRINQERRIQKKLVQRFCFIDADDAVRLTNTMIDALITHKRHNEQI